MDGQTVNILSLNEPSFMGFFHEIESYGLSVTLLYAKVSGIPAEDKEDFAKIAKKYGIKIGDEGMPFEQAIEDLRKRKLGGKTLK